MRLKLPAYFRKTPIKTAYSRKQMATAARKRGLVTEHLFRVLKSDPMLRDLASKASMSVINKKKGFSNNSIVKEAFSLASAKEKALLISRLESEADKINYWFSRDHTKKASKEIEKSLRAKKPGQTEEGARRALEKANLIDAFSPQEMRLVKKKISDLKRKIKRNSNPKETGKLQSELISLKIQLDEIERVIKLGENRQRKARELLRERH